MPLPLSHGDEQHDALARSTTFPGGFRRRWRWFIGSEAYARGPVEDNPKKGVDRQAYRADAQQ